METCKEPNASPHLQDSQTNEDVYQQNEKTPSKLCSILTREKLIAQPDNNANGVNSHPDISKRIHYDTFQTWAMKNYGENSKTKTVTKRKYLRIIATLTGEELPNSENAKFRFWVKAKGFKLGPVNWRSNSADQGHVLYVPTKVQSSQGTRKEYKQVAVIDDFFHIIYSMHVDSDARGGKHAGQKRTYRAIAETYAFLPREAVTRFLMACTDCQKRMYLSLEPTANKCTGEKATPKTDGTESRSGRRHLLKRPLVEQAGSVLDLQDVNFNLPITTTYFNSLKRLKQSVQHRHQVGTAGKHNEPFTMKDGRVMLDHPLAAIDLSDKGGTDEVTKLTESGGSSKPTCIDERLSSNLNGPLRDNSGSKRASSTCTFPEPGMPHSATPPLHTSDNSYSISNIISYSENHCIKGERDLLSDQSAYGPLNWIKSTIGTNDGYAINKLSKGKEMHPTKAPVKAEACSLQSYPVLPPSGYTSLVLPVSSYLDNPHNLSVTQMIAGYREAAAFLYRSAQELEKMLLAYS